MCSQVYSVPQKNCMDMFSHVFSSTKELYGCVFHKITCARNTIKDCLFIPGKIFHFTPDCIVYKKVYIYIYKVCILYTYIYIRYGILVQNAYTHLQNLCELSYRKMGSCPIRHTFRKVAVTVRIRAWESTRQSQDQVRIAED